MEIDKYALELVMQTGGEAFGRPVVVGNEMYEAFMPVMSKDKNDLEYYMLESLLEQATTAAMYEESEIGYLLSGGVDSSLLLHLIKKRHIDVQGTKVIAYHTDFGVPEKSEVADAKLMCDKLGIELRIIDVSPKAQVPHIDESLIMTKTVSYGVPPTYMAFSQMRQDGIAVAVSALGLDELMAGYTIHRRFFERGSRYFPFVKSRSKVFRYLMGHYGNDKAFMILNTLASPHSNFVRGVELDPHEFYQALKTPSLWDTIQRWTHRAMIDNFATLTDRCAKANGIKLLFPYIHRKLMDYCYDLKPTQKFNKEPIRRYMKYEGIPQQIIQKGRAWDKIGWGGTPLPYFDCDSYMAKIGSNAPVIADWFEEETIDYVIAYNNRQALQMLLFSKLLELMDC
jgi:asparagine synthetase B (glutamine-hydrolysing)